MHPIRLVALSLLAALLSAASAESKPAAVAAGPLTIANAWSRETAAGQSAGGGFVTITNRGAAADRLLAASSPAAAEVQIHRMSMEGGVMRMRQMTDGLAIPAAATVTLRPGSYHLMLVGLTAPLTRGASVPVELRFERAGRVRVPFRVEAVTATGATGGVHAGH